MLHNLKRRISLLENYVRSELRKVHHKALILHPAKTVYIPIPKAANTSITLSLYPTLDLAIPPVNVMRRANGLTYTSVTEALQIAGADWFIFSVVRNPIDRSKSAYRNKVLMEDPTFRPCANMGVRACDDFESFLRACNRCPRGNLNDHFQPQSTLLNHALKDDRFRLYKFENLALDWTEICDQIELRGCVRPSALPRENVSNQIPMQVSAEAVEIAYKIYRRDFCLFEYHFGV